MWKIENLESPFCAVSNSIIHSWLHFVMGGMKRPYTILSEKLSVILENACLNPIEIFDVETSWKEIKTGKCKRYTNIEELLKDLKT